MILGKGVSISEGYKENQNVLVLGVPGSGKTRNIVLPYLMETQNSCVVLDPKGDLYKTTHGMLRERGFHVVMYDFMDPANSPHTYNPLAYIQGDHDVLAFTELLVEPEKNGRCDPFWPLATQLLANALVGAAVTGFVPEAQTIGTVNMLLNMSACPPETSKSDLDIFFEIFDKRFPNHSATRFYNSFKTVADSEKTRACILVELATVLAPMLSNETMQFLSTNSYDLHRIGREKTVVFVRSSDVDRSNDFLVNLFFRQLFDVLTNDADSTPNGTLPIHVHFILDDFGTNLRISRFDSLLAGCRSREISCTVILQSTGQLKAMYGESWSTILGSCKSFVFLGSNDLDTCYDISLRLDVPVRDILYKNVEDIFIFTQGEPPHKTKRFDVTTHRLYPQLDFGETEKVRIYHTELLV